MKHSEDIDKALKDQLAGKSAVVPDFVWENIEAELFPEKKRRGFFWWFLPALGLMITGVLIFFLTRYTTAEIEQQKTTSPAYTERSAKEHSKGNTDSGKRSSARQRSVFPKETSYQSAAKAAHALPRSGFSDSSKPAESEYKRNDQRIALPTGAEVKNTPNGNRSPGITPDNPDGPAQNDITGDPGTTADPGKSIPAAQPEKTESTSPACEENEGPLTVSFPLVDVLAFKPASLDNRAKLPLPYQKATQEDEEPSFFSMEVYGGPSLYNTAVFKDYFTSGQLSRRTFASSGFETGINAHFSLTPKLGLYTGIAFNSKQSGFRYNLAVTEADYFGLLNGEKIPLANISDNGLNSCFLAQNATASYRINSLLLSVGGTYELLKWRKFQLGIHLKLSMNLQSAMKLEETEVIEIPEPEKERFSYFQPGGGLTFSYQLTDRFSVGVAPVFSRQSGRKSDSFYRDLDELIVPVSLKIRF